METEPGGNAAKRRAKPPSEEPLRMFNFPVRLREADRELIHRAGESTVEWIQRVVDAALAAERARRQP